MNPKIKWLRDKINMENMQGMIVSNPVNIRYLTGIEAEGVLLITRKENFFITDARFLEEVKSILTINDGIIVNNISNISKIPLSQLSIPRNNIFIFPSSEEYLFITDGGNAIMLYITRILSFNPKRSNICPKYLDTATTTSTRLVTNKQKRLLLKKKDSKSPPCKWSITLFPKHFASNTHIEAT